MQAEHQYDMIRRPSLRNGIAWDKVRGISPRPPILTKERIPPKTCIDDVQLAMRQSAHLDFAAYIGRRDAFGKSRPDLLKTPRELRHGEIRALSGQSIRHVITPKDKHTPSMRTDFHVNSDIVDTPRPDDEDHILINYRYLCHTPPSPASSARFPVPQNQRTHDHLP